ncbi:hypothetical protein LCGC14_1249930 [marine sediment metagenome]|uniref:Bulb-type lectin domain-containing protein n=1 Tax=marine sediment metagenome TaxID=412755 RepID=A0A0F9P7C4_9ZZZZ
MKKNKKIYLIVVIILVCFSLVFTGNFRIFNDKNNKDNNNAQPFLSASNPVPYAVWNQTWGGGLDDSSNLITNDSSGNIYVGGTTASFGAGLIDMVLIKYNSSGTQLWNRTWGGVFDDTIYDIDFDPLGNIYISGLTTANPGTDIDMVLVKYDSSGTQLWNRTFGGGLDDRGYEVAVDSIGNVYQVGWGLSYGPGSADMYLVKYSSSGTQQWNRTWGGGAIEYCNKLEVDSLNNIYVTGITYSFGVAGDIFLVKYNSSGVQQWNRTWGGGGVDSSSIISTDSSDNIFIGGTTTSFGAGGIDMVLIKYNSSGAQQWNSTWGGGSYGADDTVHGFTIDTSGNIYTTGETWSFSPDSDLFLNKFNSSGVLQWHRRTGGWTSRERGLAVVMGPSETVYVAGHIGGTGNYQWYLANYNGSGDRQWYSVIAGGLSDSAEAVLFYSPDNIYVVGYTYSFGAGNRDIILVKYDNANPRISITSPGGNEFIGNVAPNFDISITESNLDTNWYTLDGGITNITFSGLTGTFNQTEWDKKGDGPVTLRFYANDTGGNQGYEEIIVIKDTTDPQISILSPTSNYLLGRGPPIFELSITEPNLNTTWYTLDGGITNITFSNPQGTIDQGEWSKKGNGTVSIRFYANDTLGHKGYADITVRKDDFLPQVIYYRTWGGVNSETGSAVLIDSADNVYAVGHADVSGAANYDVILVKYDRLGIQQWNLTWGGSGSEFAWASVMDSSDNIYITGSTTSFGSIAEDIFIAKFNSSGALQWNNTWGGNYKEEGYEIALDSFNNVYIAGNTLNSIISDYNACLVKFNNTGGFEWNYTWGGNNYEYTNMLGVDSLNNIYVGGDTNSFGNWMTFLLKFNITGDLIWNLTWSGSGSNSLYAMTLASLNNIYMTGETTGYGTVGGDVLILKFNSTGDLIWLQTWGGINEDFALGIALDSSENIHLVGSSESFGAGDYDYFVVKYNSLGILYWNNSWGGVNYDEAAAIGFDSYNDFYLVGSTESYGGGYYDLCLVKFDNSLPSLKINSPNQDQFYGNAPPTFDVTLNEANLNTTWYTLNDGVNQPFSGLTGTIDQLEWDTTADGSVSIKFFINDSGGHEVFSQIDLFKDTFAPTSGLTFSPVSGINIVNISTAFTLTADDGFGSGVSLIRYRINNSAWIDYMGSFDLSSYADGDYLIGYQAIDEMNNIETENTLVVKLVSPTSTRSSPGIPGYNLFILIGIGTFCTIILLKKKFMK